MEIEMPYKIVDESTADIEAGGHSRRASQDISWSDVNFKAGDKSILTNCYGSVPAGKVCAIMGPSGAGKSSLLNVLAGRSASNGHVEVSGTITVAGKKIDPVKFRQSIAYVMQDDALMPTATPREAFEFSASLRLPATTSKETIKKLVDQTIIDLGLESCADVMIGGALIKGISGGQRKRTSVGVEIITNPSLLFLDEPTSGLDSFSASNCVQLLKTIAQKNAAVLCTIHQPSSEVFFLFDLCIFMKDGVVFYQGPVSNLTSYLSKFGYSCPANYNPSDYVMFLCQVETMEKATASGLLPANEAAAENIRALLSTAPSSPTKAITAGDNEDGYSVQASATFSKQVYLLSARELVDTYRDVASLASRFGITILLNLLFGLIFLGAGAKDNSNTENFSAHFGAVTMVSIFSMFGAAQPVMLAFPFQRPLFMREYSTGTYGPVAYFLSKLALELPMTFLQTVVQYIVAFFLIDFQGSFIYEVLAAWGLGAAACSVSVMMGCVLDDVKDVTEMAPLLFVPQLLFAGFFIRTSSIPVFLRWAQYLCSMKYSINLILMTEFNPSSKSCQGENHQACLNVLEENNIKQDDWWIYAILLFVIFLAFRLIGAYNLIRRAKRFY